jgi:peptidoglycan-N-acetylglucosamine deacetylase
MKNIIKLALSYFYPDRFILRRLLNARHGVAITFDDGPHPDNTVKLLRIFKEFGVKATFFVCGSEVEKYPELISAIQKEGHEIGNHAFSHKRIRQIGWNDYSSEIKDTARIIEQKTGKSITLFRPPYGELNLSLVKFVLQNKWLYIGWTVDSDDSFVKDKDKLVEQFAKKTIKPGDIILFHEDYGTTIEAMPDIIKDIKKRGYSLLTISELLRK